MRRVHADFAPPSRWPVRWVLGCALGLLAAAAWQADLAWEAAARLGAAQLGEDQAKGALRHAEAQLRGTASVASTPPYSRDAREIARLASFDMGAVLRALESAQVKGIKVTRMDAEAATRKVEVDVEAVDADAASAYVQALNAGNPGSPWALLRIQASGTADLVTLRAELP